MEEEIIDEFRELPELPRKLKANYEVLYCKEGIAAHQYYVLFPNGVIVLGITNWHPIVQKGKDHQDIEIILDSTDLWEVSERGEKAKYITFKDHSLCRVKLGDELYEVNHPRDTRLMNFNQCLRTNPGLLLERCLWEGHIAVLYASNRTISRMKRWYNTVSEYAEFLSISELEVLI